MPRRGSDALTEEVRASVEARGGNADLLAAVQRIADAEEEGKRARVYRKAIKEYVQRWETAQTTASPPTTPPRSGVFP